MNRQLESEHGSLLDGSDLGTPLPDGHFHSEYTEYDHLRTSVENQDSLDSQTQMPAHNDQPTMLVQHLDDEHPLPPNGKLPTVDIPLKDLKDSKRGVYRGKADHTTKSPVSYHTAMAASTPHANSFGPHYLGHMWMPGMLRSFPHRGFWAILGSLACVIANIVVLVKSDGDYVQNWTLSPTVYLAVFTTFTNMLARFAFHDGVKLSWWRTALHGGTVEHLHEKWSHADGFWAALSAGRSFNMVTLASLAVTLIVIDQPLIQRASSVVPVQARSMVEVVAPIAPEIPWASTGYQSGRDDQAQLMTQSMLQALEQYNQQLPLQSTFYGCNGICTGFVNAGGLAARCNTTQGPIQYVQSRAAGSSDYPFEVSFDFMEGYADSESQVIMHVAYSEYLNTSALCGAIRTERTCALTSATIRYPITIQEDQIVLGNVSRDGIVTGLQPRDPEGSAGDYVFFTLGGFHVAAKALFSAQSSYTWGGAIGTFITLPDTLSNQFLKFTLPDPNNSTAAYDLSYAKPCTSSWEDPTTTILNALNSMAFGLSLKAAHYPYRHTNTAPSPQVLTMEQTSIVNVFHSEYKFLVASAVLSILLIGLIMPTFIGWWELGRSVTLNPIETAKAFDAPLLRGPGSNAPLKQLVRQVGSRSVRWGGVEVVHDASDGVETNNKTKTTQMTLMLGSLSEVLSPKKATIYY